MIRIRILSVLLFLAATGGFFLYRMASHRQDFEKASFSGVIENITYSTSGFPTVRIEGESYDLGFGTKGELKAGDSLVKRSGSTLVRQYREGKLIWQYATGE